MSVQKMDVSLSVADRYIERFGVVVNFKFNGSFSNSLFVNLKASILVWINKSFHL